MGVCIMGCTKGQQKQRARQEAYAESEVVANIQQQLAIDHQTLDKEEDISSAIQKLDQKPEKDKEGSTLQTNESTIRKSRFLKSNLNNSSLPPPIEAPNTFNSGQVTLHKPPTSLLKTNSQTSSIKSKFQRQKPHDQSILKNGKYKRARKTTSPSKNVQKIKQHNIYPKGGDFVMQKSVKESRRKKVSVEQDNQYGEGGSGPSFADNLTETDIKTTPESTLKDPTCLHTHRIPDSQQQATNLVSQNLIKSTLAFKSPTLLNTQVYFSDQSTYIGEWMAGAKHGKGKLIYAKGCYEGFWREDQFCGKGDIIFSNGQSYSGEWEGHKANGHGVFQYNNGSTYQGEWKNNKQNGFGRHQWSPDEYYSGYWSQGCKQGKGELVFADGSFYKGEFNGNQLHGHGQYFYKERKQTYTGTWEHNQKSGWGVLELQDGSKYEGQFKHDKMNGQGKLTEVDGTTFQGLWENGKRQGIIVSTAVDGTKTQELWYYGKFVQNTEDLSQSSRRKKKKKKRYQSEEKSFIFSV